MRRSSLYSARSQPDLFNLINEPIEREYTEIQEDEDTRLPTMSKLRSALSVQNLLDIDDKVSNLKPLLLGPVRKINVLDFLSHRVDPQKLDYDVHS